MELSEQVVDRIQKMRARYEELSPDIERIERFLLEYPDAQAEILPQFRMVFSELASEVTRLDDLFFEMQYYAYARADNPDAHLFR